MLIFDVRHDWPKKAGYMLERPYGRAHYIFAHYYTDVSLQCGDAFYQIPAGGCVLIEPHVPHRLECTDDLTHDWIHLGTEASAMIRQHSIPVNTPLFFNNSSVLADMIWKMETEFYSSNPFKEELLELYVREFLIYLHRFERKIPETGNLSDATVKKMIVARRTILANSEKSWTLEEMAALAHFSPSRFHTIYKVLFGTTPTKDLIKIRVNLAESLLYTEPDLTLAAVAERLGYNDQYHFIRQFKAITGQSPGKYRKSRT